MNKHLDCLNFRMITSTRANVRTTPEMLLDYSNIAPDYPNGLFAGDIIRVVGYTAGQNVTPCCGPMGKRFCLHGRYDDAWYITDEGYYVWANVAEDDIKGLKYYSLWKSLKLADYLRWNHKHG